MAFHKKLPAFASALFALALSHTSLAAPISGCANNPGSPANLGGVLTTSYTCNLFNTGVTTTINLTPYMTQGGASLSANDIGAGYDIVINADPLTLSANDTNEAALFNQSLWSAVLFFPSDQPQDSSDTLIVYWPGSFPSSSTIRSLDEAIYGAGADSQFFFQKTGAETSFGGIFQTYNVFTDPVATPEPSTWVLLFSGMLGLGAIAGIKRHNPLHHT